MTTHQAGDDSSPDIHAMTESMARNAANWHDVSVRALGIATAWTDTLWWRMPGGSPIYVGAILLAPDSGEQRAELQKAQKAWGDERLTIYDAWATYKGDGFSGVILFSNAWFLRLPSPFTPLPSPQGLTVTRATTLEGLGAFERATIQGFADSANALPDHQHFSQHPAATLDDPNMVYLVARLDGEIVATTIAHMTCDMLGIYGLSTLPKYRRRGYARALIHASVALRPDMPASVHPDPATVPIYSDIAFFPAGDLAVWKMR